MALWILSGLLDGTERGKRQRGDEQMELRETFDTVAELYATARPSYPDEIVDAVPPGNDVLEVACGAGQLTKQLVERGRRVTCVELGPNLARVAQREVPEARVINANFESWPVDGSYDVVACATAWGWIDDVLKYQQAHRALRPGGHLAIIGGYHVYPPGEEDLFFRQIQEVYESIGEPRMETWPTPENTDTTARVAEINTTGLFTHVRELRTVQEIRYTPESYIDVLKTFSGHILMSERQREAIFDGVRRLAGPIIRKHFLVVLWTARAVD